MCKWSHPRLSKQVLAAFTSLGICQGWHKAIAWDSGCVSKLLFCFHWYLRTVRAVGIDSTCHEFSSAWNCAFSCSNDHLGPNQWSWNDAFVSGESLKPESQEILRPARCHWKLCFGGPEIYPVPFFSFVEASARVRASILYSTKAYKSSAVSRILLLHG